MSIAFLYLSYPWSKHEVKFEILDEIVVKYLGGNQLFSPEFQAFGTY